MFLDSNVHVFYTIIIPGWVKRPWKSRIKVTCVSLCYPLRVFFFAVVWHTGGPSWTLCLLCTICCPLTWDRGRQEQALWSPLRSCFETHTHMHRLLLSLRWWRRQGKLHHGGRNQSRATQRLSLLRPTVGAQGENWVQPCLGGAAPVTGDTLCFAPASSGMKCSQRGHSRRAFCGQKSFKAHESSSPVESIQTSEMGILEN